MTSPPTDRSSSKRRPLPAYELEELGPAEDKSTRTVVTKPDKDPFASAGIGRCNINERLASDTRGRRPAIPFLDDPFSGEGQRAGFAVAPTTSTSGTERKHGARANLPSDVRGQLPATEVDAARDTERQKRMSKCVSDGLSDALEEADFYAARSRAGRAPRPAAKVPRPLRFCANASAGTEPQAATQASGTRALPRADGDDRALDLARHSMALG